jgi:hypothetical protein
MNAQTLIAGAMRTLGALGTGESPSAAEAQDGLAALNDMIDTWAAEHLTIPVTTRSTYSLVAATQTYTIGPGVAAPNFDQVRPVSLAGVGILLTDSPTIETPLDPFTEDEWRELALKTQSGTPTRYIYGGTAPAGTLTLWPVPDAADTLAVYWPTPLTAFADLTTDYSLPRAYAEALRYNLAVRLSSEFGKPLTQIVKDLADEFLGTVKRSNKQLSDLRVDAALLGHSGGFNIYTGDFR